MSSVNLGQIYINSIPNNTQQQLQNDLGQFRNHINSLNQQIQLTPKNDQKALRAEYLDYNKRVLAILKQKKHYTPSNSKKQNKQKKQKDNTNQIDTFNAPKQNTRQKINKGPLKGSKSSIKAGILFPVPRIKRYLKKGNYNKRIGQGACVYLTAVLDYLAEEVLELAGNAARDLKKKTINPRHIQLAVRNDEELNKLLGHVTIAQGGVLPNIHSVLLPRK